MTKKGMKTDLEPFVLVILVAITVIEFLIFAGGIKYDAFIEALNAMITLMIFGAVLLLISIITRIHDLNKSLLTLFSQYFASATSSTTSASQTQKTSTRKNTKKKKRR